MSVGSIRNVSVVGAGLMGHGIAQEFLVAGYTVHLHDVSVERLAAARENIRKNLLMLAGLGLAPPGAAESFPGLLTTTTDIREAVAEADIVIEAAFEDLELKRDIFRSIDALAPAHAILASNSSSFMPGLMASATRRPGNVLVAHYFNPPYLLPLVEIVRHEKTSDETVNTVCGLLKGLGKTPVVVRKESPGFIGNRLQAALFREALSIVEHGIATPADVDTVIREGFGRRLGAAGVFEIWEIAGWDLILAICENLFPTLEPRTTPAPTLKEMVARGELGVKSGRGFYEWTPESVSALKTRIATTLTEIARVRRTG
ncbi:MAG TPA: 3-hydroxyacyl-CoA dehydrogenase family protein [Bacteroidota bacterium]|nr:3-hydroxyacyl-CoA dehydrogenase family protein [Bacteroidota bacterium]